MEYVVEYKTGKKLLRHPVYYNVIQPGNESGLAVTTFSPTATEVSESCLNPIITSTRVITIK